jgi:hypothetical protein
MSRVCVLTLIKQGAEANGEAGDQYAGLSRFGRVLDQRWLQSTLNVDWYRYAYDREGKRLYRENVMNSANQRVRQFAVHATLAARRA